MIPEPAAYALGVADLESDRERILALWRTGLAQDGRPEAKYDWYYRDHPEGAPSVFFLQAPAGSEPVGAASLARRRMRLGSSAVVGGVLADFVVADSHRSFFPAHFLQKSVRVHALADCGVVFGMPNPQSEAVVRRAGYRRVGEAVRHVRVLRTAGYLGRHLPDWIARLAGPLVDGLWLAGLRLAPGLGSGLRATWSDSVPEGIDDLWSRTAAEGVLMGARDARFLDWRFARCPLHRYRFLALRTSAGTLAAYAVVQQPKGDLVEVSDFLVDQRIDGAGVGLWREIALRAHADGAAGASVEFLGPPSEASILRVSGWVERERRGIYAAVAEGAGIGPAHWYLTAADEDV